MNKLFKETILIWERIAEDERLRMFEEILRNLPWQASDRPTDPNLCHQLTVTLSSQ
jgi:hypothetical protein